MTLATYLTLLRILFIPPILCLLWLNQDWASWAAFGLYTLACFTDYFDGWVARHSGTVTLLGKFMDPIADKLLVVTVLVLLVAQQRLEGVHILPVMIILIREITVSGLREHLATLDQDVPVSYIAKWKTASQMFALGFLMLGNLTTIPLWIAWSPLSLLIIGHILIWVAAALTLYTGWEYLKAGLRIILK